MLFRKEAISHQSERLTGAITLAQPLSIKVTVIILVTVAFSIVTFLFNAEYSRKETVRGFLMPDKGVIKSFANQGGTIEKLWVKEGSTVVKGQPLATIIVQQSNSSGVDLSAQLTDKLNEQSHLILDEINQHRTLEIQELLNLQTQKLAEASKHITYGIANAKDDMTKTFYETQQPYQVSLKAAFMYLKALHVYNEDRKANIDKAVDILDATLKTAPNFNLIQISKTELLRQKQALAQAAAQPKN